MFNLRFLTVMNVYLFSISKSTKGIFTWAIQNFTWWQEITGQTLKMLLLLGQQSYQTS